MKPWRNRFDRSPGASDPGLLRQRDDGCTSEWLPRSRGVSASPTRRRWTMARRHPGGVGLVRRSCRSRCGNPAAVRVRNAATGAIGPSCRAAKDHGAASTGRHRLQDVQGSRATRIGPKVRGMQAAGRLLLTEAALGICQHEDGLETGKLVSDSLVGALGVAIHHGGWKPPDGSAGGEPDCWRRPRSFWHSA